MTTNNGEHMATSHVGCTTTMINGDPYADDGNETILDLVSARTGKTLRADGRTVDGSPLEITMAVNRRATTDPDEPLRIGGLELTPRLIMGTGGSTSMVTLERALVASGTQLATVAIRRVVAGARQSVFEILQRHRITALAMELGCDAVLLASAVTHAHNTGGHGQGNEDGRSGWTGSSQVGTHPTSASSARQLALRRYRHRRVRDPREDDNL